MEYNRYGSGSNSSNWDILFKELGTLKQQSTNIEKKLDTSINRLDGNLAKLTDYVEDRLNKHSKKSQKIEDTMFEMNTVMEKKFMALEKEML